MPEERRVVTVLFVDLVGLDASTTADAGADAENAADLVDAVFTRFRRVIESRGGTVDKFVGQTAMGIFGAPVAHEDDPLRAVRAALAMRRELELFNAQRGLSLVIRVGVNSGEVLWGSVGGDRPTVMGDTVNVAQRLQTEARPGEVLAARAVARATAGRVVYGGEREMHLRGRQDTVIAGEVLREADSVPATAAGEVASARLVGREADLERLAALVASGKGMFVLIEGDAGVGKTRLASEVRQRALKRSPDLWIGLGHAQENSPLPLGPFAEVVRSAARVMPGGGPGAEADETRAFVSGVLALTVPGAAERSNFAHLMTRSMGQAAGSGPLPGDATRARTETLEAWEKWIRALARRAPVLLCLEDLHWADPATFSLLDHLAVRLRSEPVAILATSRPAQRIPGGFERLRLAELAAGDSATLARELLGRELDPALADFLVEQSAGNPLYMEELVRFLTQEGLVSGRPARFESRPDRLPDGLRGLLVSRIDSVSAEAREALKCGSVFGRAFWAIATGTLAGHDVAAALEQAGRRRLVERAGSSLLTADEEFHFRQNPLRDAAYSLLTKKERQRLHSKAADILEPLAEHLGRRLLILAAGHREAALQPGPASKLWASAASEAADHSAYEEALASAREAQRIDGSVEGSIQAVRSLSMLGFNELSIAEALALLDSPTLTPKDHLRLRRFMALAHERRGEFEKSLEIEESILADPGAAWMHELGRRNRTNLLIRLSRYDEALEEIDASARRAEAAISAGAGSRAKKDLADSLTAEARVRMKRREYGRAMEAYRRAYVLDIESGNPLGAANTRNGMGTVHMSIGEWAEARAAFEEAATAFRETGDRWKIAMVLTNIATVEFEEGNAEAALKTVEAALAIRRDIGDQWGEAMLLSNRGWYRQRMGEPRAAIDSLEHAIELRRATGDRFGVALSLDRLAESFLDLGDLGKAREAASRCLEIRSSLGLAKSIADARRLMGDVLAAEGRAEEALREFDAASAAGDAESETARAELLSDRGDPEAGKVCESAVESARNGGDRETLLRALCAAAHFELAAGNRAAAAKLVAEAGALPRNVRNLRLGRRLATLEAAISGPPGAGNDPK